MTKKDYELIERVFLRHITKHLVLAYEMRYDNDSVDYVARHKAAAETLVQFADKLATELKAHNKDFDYDKFMNASGVLNNPFDTESEAFIA